MSLKRNWWKVLIAIAAAVVSLLTYPYQTTLVILSGLLVMVLAAGIVWLLWAIVVLVGGFDGNTA